jgi:hypothetical protein
MYGTSDRARGDSRSAVANRRHPFTASREISEAGLALRVFGDIGKSAQPNGGYGTNRKVGGDISSRDFISQRRARAHDFRRVRLQEVAVISKEV